MIGRLVRSADFERVLRTRSRASSVHFAVHYVADRPSRAWSDRSNTSEAKLSTGDAPSDPGPVDDSAAPATVWLGTVVPKRHAKRSVTRSLLKRQIHGAVARQPALGGGMWVVRLRAPFDKTQFPSAASQALLRVARAELDGVLARAATR